MSMNRETILNIVLAALLIAVPVIAQIMGEPFIITLATKVAILGMAGVGLNIALGFGGLVSFGHAAFFGIGGYAAGILASHALNYEPIMTAPFEINGTTQMIVIWIVALIASALVALLIGAITLRTSGVYFIMITLAFAQMIYYFVVDFGTQIIGPRHRFPGTPSGKHQRCCHRKALLITTDSRDFKIKAGPPQPFRHQPKLKHLAKAAGRGKADLQPRGRHRHLVNPVHLRKAEADAVLKPFFDRRIDHFEIARIKNDPRRVAMLKQDFLGIGECRHLTPPDTGRQGRRSNRQPPRSMR